MSGPMVLWPARGQAVCFPNKSGYFPRPQPSWTAETLQSLLSGCDATENLLQPQWYLRAAPSPEAAEAIKKLLDEFQAGVKGVRRRLESVVNFPTVSKSPNALILFTDHDLISLKSAFHVLAEIVAEIPVLAEALYQEPRSDNRHFVIGMVFAFSSILYAAISLASVVLQLALPPLFPVVLSLTMACASAVVQIGNKLYESQRERESAQWQQCQQAFQDFVNQLQKFKESAMWNTLTHQLNQLNQVQNNLQQQVQQEFDVQKQTTDTKIRSLEQAVQELKAMIITQAEAVASPADFKQAVKNRTQALLEAGQSAPLIYQQLEKETRLIVDEAIAGYQASLKQKQQQAQANLTAAEYRS